MEKGKESRARRLCTLFFSMLVISAFTFGGGFVIVTLMKKRFVDRLRWLEEEEMLDMTALAQTAPGPIAVNAAVQVGWRVAGLPGMLTAVAATVLPPLVTISLISVFYARFAEDRAVALMLKGMQAGVAALLADVAVRLGTGVAKERSPFHICVMAAAFVAVAVFRVNVTAVILAAALLGLAAALFGRRGRG